LTIPCWELAVLEEGEGMGGRKLRKGRLGEGQEEDRGGVVEGDPEGCIIGAYLHT